MKKVILIGGSPFSGKSTLARELAARNKYSCLSTDDIHDALKLFISDKTPHPMHSMPHEKYVLHYSVNELIDHAQQIHAKMAPSIKAIIQSHANWSSPVIIEGWALYPEWVSNLPYSNIDSIWLIASEEVLLHRIEADEEFYKKSDNPTRFIQQYLARNLWHNNHILATANSFGMKTIAIDLKTSIKDLLEIACKQLNYSG